MEREINVIIKGEMNIFLFQLIEKEMDKAFKGLSYVRTATDHKLTETIFIYKPFYREIES